MNKNLFIACIPIVFFLITGCGDDGDTIFSTIEKEKLSPPLGLKSVTQNEQVTLFWYTSNYEEDFGGYFVFQAEGDYTSLSSDNSIDESIFAKVDSITMSGSSDAVVSATITGLANGTTYSFAVASFDKDDHEKISYPSNIVKDTPRPDINTVTVQSASTGDVTGNDSQAGFDFNEFEVVEVPDIMGDYTTEDQVVDMVNEAFDPSAANTNIRPWIAGMNGAGLQDLGYMENLDGSDIAPAQGYSDTGKSIAVLLGHLYAIKTGDNLYGKLIITAIGGAAENYAITFNAALQLNSGDRNYKIESIDRQLGID
jgi:hypothetical protein